ncbi:MAG: Asp23/Gls24 family envelope stress response protein [Candidatus Bipolaricaulia bacterium]
MEEKRGKANEIVGELGKIAISEEVITKIAELAVAEVEGLGEVKGSLVGQAARVFGGRGKGVETKLENDSVRFKMRVSLQYGQPIPQVAQEIQEEVARRVEEMTGLTVSGVDIYIQEVQLPKPPAPAEDELYYRVLEVIEAHPEGIKLAEIGKALGMDWRLLTSAARRIIAEGRARKEGKEYFPPGG